MHKKHQEWGKSGYRETESVNTGRSISGNSDILPHPNANANGFISWSPTMRDRLPQFVSSLSKYIRVERYYDLVAAISHDTPESVLRARFDPNLYANAKQRYLIVTGGKVIRDKLLDFVHDEGSFTERVKMVMYFLFMFRDARYRKFICEEVGKRDGKWDTSIFHDTNSEHFKNAGGYKAFTNLRQFLFQTGILDERSLTVPGLSRWFSVGIKPSR